jgi:hypothetical protein
VFHVVPRVWGGQSRNRGSIPGKGKRYSLLPNVSVGSGVYPASFSVSTEGKATGRDTDLSLLLVLGFRMCGAVPPHTIRCALKAQCLSAETTPAYFQNSCNALPPLLLTLWKLYKKAVCRLFRFSVFLYLRKRCFVSSLPGPYHQ